MTLRVLAHLAILASPASPDMIGFCHAEGAGTRESSKSRGIFAGPPFGRRCGMPRRPRILYPNAVYHVMARGNRKALIFEDDADRQLFLELTGEAVARYGLRTYGYCQMGNHYHQIVETPRGNLPEAMRFLNGVYAQKSNRRHGRTGHLFGARYRSLVIQREGYLRRALRYAVLNPVRAGLVADPGEWLWSSYRATAGLAPAPEWLSLDWLEWALEAEPGVDPREKYSRYVNDGAPRRGVINPNALVLGSRDFRERLANACRGPERLLPAGYHAISRPPLNEILGVAASSSLARAEAACRAHVTHGYSQHAIARELKVDASTVSRWLKKLRAAPPSSRQADRQGMT